MNISPHPEYYSFVFSFPKTSPFDKDEYRHASFLGEFVRPLVADASRYVHYWSTYYGNQAKLRIYTERIDEIRNDAVSLQNRLGLKPEDEEKYMSLVGDLGHKRFIGDKSTSQQERRAFKILTSLRAVTDLALDSIQQRPDGYWEFEENQDQLQNPVGNHLFSVTHLYHNITGTDCKVVAFEEGPGKRGILGYYTFHNAVGSGQIKPTSQQEIVVKH